MSIPFHAANVGELTALLAGLDPATPLAFPDPRRPHFVVMNGFHVEQDLVAVPNHHAADDIVAAVILQVAP